MTIKKTAEAIVYATGVDRKTDRVTAAADATSQKLLDVSKLAETGWTAKISLEEGLARTVDWYHGHIDTIRQ